MLRFYRPPDTARRGRGDGDDDRRRRGRVLTVFPPRSAHGLRRCCSQRVFQRVWAVASRDYQGRKRPSSEGRDRGGLVLSIPPIPQGKDQETPGGPRCPSQGDRLWRAQHRPHGNYMRLTMRGKGGGVRAAAVARELLGFVWAIACTVQSEIVRAAGLYSPRPLSLAWCSEKDSFFGSGEPSANLCAKPCTERTPRVRGSSLTVT